MLIEVRHLSNHKPRPVSTFQSYFQTLLKGLRNPGPLISQTTNSLQSLRNLDSAKLVTGGVVVAEVLGFFTVGEMIGRMKLVGYRGETDSHH
jgi:F-type H+-transporting ATPase subunit g